MSEKKWLFAALFLNILIINGVVLAVMNLRYPLIGHDYTLALPSLLDTALHYRLNGLTIQWFTPTFGGGIPVFPNPNNMQFSIPTFLAVILPPWDAMLVSTVLYVAGGFMACFYFFNKTLGLHWTSSILGAAFFSANGFAITRIATGQVGYLSFTLLAIFLIVFLDKKISVQMAAPMMGILLAMYIHSGGYFIIIIFGLSILMSLPMIYLYKPELFDWKRFAVTLAGGGTIGLVIALSKLTATFSFMRFFPRLVADNSPSPFVIGLLGILLQLLGTQNLVPLFLLGGLDPVNYPNFTRGATGTSYGMWELDTSVTPVVFIILIISLVRFLRGTPRPAFRLNDRSIKLAVFCLFFFIWLAIEFSLGKGLVYPALKNLPILSSLRGNVRFVGAFIFPLALSAAIIYNKWIAGFDRLKQWRTFLAVNALAILPLSSYFLFKQDMLWMFYDVRVPQGIFEEIRAGESFEITEIGTPPGHNTGALLYRTSNLNLYEPVFGFELENFHPRVQPGSIWSITDDRYNLTDPTGFVYPELNGNQPFDRFRKDDQETMQLFVKHLQPEWKIPAYQRMVNWISLTAMFITLIYLAIQTRLHATRAITA